MLGSISALAPIRSIPNAEFGVESMEALAPIAPPTPISSTTDLALTGTGKDLFWQAQHVGGGHSLIELGDDYALGLNTLQHEVVLANRKTNETTRIFGSSEVAIDGAKQFQFWGTTTFALANGTKITANTVPHSPDSTDFLLDRLTITDEHRALVISGFAGFAPPAVPSEPIAPAPAAAAPPSEIPAAEPAIPLTTAQVPEAPATTGPLPTAAEPAAASTPMAEVPTSQPPSATTAPVEVPASPLPAAPKLSIETFIGEHAACRIDGATRDGYVLEENTTGAGWISEWTDMAATQRDLNDTAIGEVFGPNSTTMSLGEFGSFLNRLFITSISFAFAQSMRQQSYEMLHETRTREHDSAGDRARLQKRLIEMQDIRKLAEMVDPYEMMLQQASRQMSPFAGAA